MRRVFLTALLVGVAMAAFAVPNPKFPWPDEGGQARSLLVFKASMGSFNGDSGCMVADVDAGGDDIFADCTTAGNFDQIGYPMAGTLTVSGIVCNHGAVGTWDSTDQVSFTLATALADGSTVTNIGNSWQLTASGGGGDVEITADGQGYDLANQFTVTVSNRLLVMRVTSATDANAGALMWANCAVEHTYTPD